MAPVLERGVTGREVYLPDEVAWTDWHSLEPASTGWFEATEGHTPVFGGGGPFTEGDGTSYTPSGGPTGQGEGQVSLTSGIVDVAGVTLSIDGPKERSYTVIVVP